MLDELFGLAALAKLVFDRDKLHRHWALGRQKLGHRAAEATRELMLFNRDDRAGALGRSKHQLAVERLNSVEVNDRHRDILLDLFGGNERVKNKRACGKNNDITVPRTRLAP